MKELNLDIWHGAILDAKVATKWIVKRLNEVQPYWRNKPYKDMT